MDIESAVSCPQSAEADTRTLRVKLPAKLYNSRKFTRGPNMQTGRSRGKRGSNKDDPCRNLKSIRMSDYPDGYPRFASLMTSDTNTRVYRRFGWERNRLLLYRQDRVAEASSLLKALDKADDEVEAVGLYSRREDEVVTPCHRSLLLQRMEADLNKYDELLLREHAVASIARPTPANHRAILSLVYSTKPLVAAEYEYLYQSDDFVLLGDEGDRWLRSFEDKIWSLSRLPFLKGLLSSRKRLDPEDAHTHYTSNYRASLVIKLTVSIMTTILLVLPVILLYVLNTRPGIKLMILLLFVVAFSLAISIMTNVKRHEIFAAAAAYCAVLVVFLANVPALGGGQVGRQ